MSYSPAPTRYEKMTYVRCGNSGLKLPRIALGLWHNFGDASLLSTSREMLHSAFDLGITHIDLANNYGPPPGSAELNFGQILKEDFHNLRDELIISSKAGFTMWPGPYGDWGSKKYLVSSLNQSLKRMGLEYVDIFYHHRPDPDTPLEETMAALDLIVRQGKALYVGISNYPADKAAQAISLLKQMGTPCLIHQPRYSMFDRWVEDGLLQVLQNEGVGSIAYSPLAGGLLTNRYLNGIPQDSRIASISPSLTADHLSDKRLDQIKQLNQLAEWRGQKLSQMALAWVLRNVSVALIGASRVSQIKDAVTALDNLTFTQQELEAIEAILR